MAKPMPVVRGTLDVLVLKALTWAPMHGFEVTSWIENRSGKRLELEDAALYQALYRMEKKGLVSAEWGVTEHNRRARYYQLTPEGQEYLAEQVSHWLEYADTITDILLQIPRAG